MIALAILGTAAYAWTVWYLVDWRRQSRREEWADRFARYSLRVW
jgi:hypothetical protein